MLRYRDVRAVGRKTLPHWISSEEFLITGYLIRVGFGVQVAKTPSYSVMCRFPFFVVLAAYVITIHQCFKQSDRQTDRQTDVMLVLVA